MNYYKIFFIILLISSRTTWAQKSVKIGKLNYYFEKIDTSTIQINGWWEVVGREYYYVEDGTPSKKTWDMRDNRKKLLISDSLMQFFSPTGEVLIKNPTFLFTYDRLCNLNETTRIVVNTDSVGFGPTLDIRTGDIIGSCSFFDKFPGKLVGFKEYKSFKDDKDLLSSYHFYFINPELIMLINDGEVTYFKRILNINNQFGWDREFNFNVIKFTGNTGNIKIILENQELNLSSLLDIRLIPQKNCNDSWFVLTTFQEEYNSINGIKLIDSKYVSKTLNNFKIPIEKLKSNYININIGNCNSKEEWILKWRIINSDIFKTVKKNKVLIYNNRFLATKMYLIKGDDVDIIEKRGDWLKIRYYGIKTIEGWIKKSDVE